MTTFEITISWWSLGFGIIAGSAISFWGILWILLVHEMDMKKKEAEIKASR